MDTRFWGPSGWEMFHRIATHSKNPHDILRNIGEVLPCKFCRNSTRRFVKINPYRKDDPELWLYEIHNMVNNKLRSQCNNDPKVINPGPDPSFESVQKKFQSRQLDEVMGKEFLLSVAVNFKSTLRKIEIQRQFLKNLSKAYPLFEEFYSKNPVDFKNYPVWMNRFTKISIETVEGYKSKCKLGKTCRKPRGGGRRLTNRRSK
jgi:hypothetical protein